LPQHAVRTFVSSTGNRNCEALSNLSAFPTEFYQSPAGKGKGTSKSGRNAERKWKDVVWQTCRRRCDRVFQFCNCPFTPGVSGGRIAPGVKKFIVSCRSAPAMLTAPSVSIDPTRQEQAKELARLQRRLFLLELCVGALLTLAWLFSGL